MPKFNKITTAFNAGELSPKLAIRGDIEQFKRALTTALNVELEPHGGVSRRGGFENSHTFIYDNSYDYGDDDKLFLFTKFEITTDLKFQILFRKSEGQFNHKIVIDIFEEGVLLQTVDYTEFNSQTEKVNFNCREIDTAQNVNNLIIVHPNIHPMILKLDDEDTRTFILEEAEIRNTPKFGFFDDLSPLSVEEQQELDFRLDVKEKRKEGSTTRIGSSKLNRRFKFSFNGEVSEEIIFYSQSLFNATTKDYERLDPVTFGNRIYFDGITDFNRELKIIINENRSGMELDLGFIKRADYASDLDFLTEISDRGNTKLKEMFFEKDKTFPLITKETLGFTSITGSYATGDLRCILQSWNLEFGGEKYLTMGSFILMGDNDITEGPVFSEDVNGTGITLYMMYEQFRKFSFVEDMNDVRITPENETYIQDSIDEANGISSGLPFFSNKSNFDAPSVRYLINFTGKMAGNYALINAEFTEPFVDPDENTKITTTKTKTGKNSTEDAWSEVRGYPASAAFIENRLVFGGSKSLDNVLWASNQGSFYNFNNSQGLPSEAILNVSATAKSLSAIQYVIGEKSLQMFTEGSEHYNPNALTTDTIALPLQSSEGCPRIKPVIIDNATYFIDKNKKTIRRFIYDDAEQSYKSENVSILSSHLIKSPVDIAAVKSENSNHIYLVNNDGTMTVFQTVRDQNISGYSLFKSEAFDFVAATESSEDLYCVVKPKIEGEYRTYLIVKYNKQKTFDLSNYSLGNVIPNAGEIYSSIGIDKTNEDLTFIECNKKSKEDFIYIRSNREDSLLDIYDFEEGLDFKVIAETMSITADVGRGEQMSEAKRINKCYLHLDNTAGWHLNYKEKEYIINYRGKNVNDTPKLFTGDKQALMKGYIDRSTITIEQVYPFRQGSVLGLTLKVKI